MSGGSDEADHGSGITVSLCDKDSDINKAISINITSVGPDDMPKWDKPALIDATSANDGGYE